MTNAEHQKRLHAFLSLLAERGMDGAVLDRRADCYYFTGYTGSDAVVVLSVKSRKGWLVTDARYGEEAEKSAPGVQTTMWKTNFAPFTGKLLKKLRLKHVGHTPSSMTAAFFFAMKAEAPAVAAWPDAGPDIARLRAVKSPAEVAAIRAALACQERAFLAARARWRIGMTETEVKNDLEWEMRRHGAEDESFETIVAVGSNASLAHAHAGERRIRPGKMLLIDFGAQVRRYCGDLTRTLWPGGIPPVWRKRYAAVLEARSAGLAVVRAGVSGRSAHMAAERVFARHGLAERFIHGLGHGVGLAVHESPSLSSYYDKPLEAGNIVTVEPGVYFPGAGGIRVEDMALVTADGAEVLSTLPRDAESAVF